MSALTIFISTAIFTILALIALTFTMVKRRPLDPTDPRREDLVGQTFALMSSPTARRLPLVSTPIGDWPVLSDVPDLGRGDEVTITGWQGGVAVVERAAS